MTQPVLAVVTSEVATSVSLDAPSSYLVVVLGGIIVHRTAFPCVYFPQNETITGFILLG
jgi:hypothetical protein